MRTFSLFLLLLPALSASNVQLNSLPAPVQKTITESLKGGTIKTITKEVENGIAQYEVESVLDGKRRDFNVDTKGSLLAIEEQTSIDAIPAAARAGILKAVGTGRLGMVETLTRGVETLYEAEFATKSGKKSSVTVKADGTVTK